MPESIAQLPLFPLTAHVLPGGKLPLRIFEARYLRMVQESYHREHAFGMCMINLSGDEAENTHIFPIGTLIRIGDFEHLPDGMLGITVEGLQCFHIQHIDVEDDGLRVADVELLDNWPPQILSRQQGFLADRLRELIASHPALSTLYAGEDYNNGSWVALRWLEMLPIDAREKQALLEQPLATGALEFLVGLIKS